MLPCIDAELGIDNNNNALGSWLSDTLYTFDTELVTGGVAMAA